MLVVCLFLFIFFFNQKTAYEMRISDWSSVVCSSDLPVGEALIMTALGLAVAVPAVLAYNWLQRRNKSIAENLGAFSVDVLGYMVSGGQVKPTNTVTAAAKPAVSTPAPATKKACLIKAAGLNGSAAWFMAGPLAP